MKNILLLILLVLSVNTFGYKHQGQTIMGTRTAPESSAILDLNSITQGFLAPRMTTAQRVAVVAPAIGLMIYDTDLNQLQVWNGAWVGVGGGDLQQTYDTGATGVIEMANAIGKISISDDTVTPIGSTLFDILDTGLTEIFGVDANGIRATRADIDNIRIDVNTISSTDANGAINFDANGTGVTNLRDEVIVFGDIDVDSARALTIGASVGANNITIGGATSTTVIAGNLQVDGTTTTVNSTTLDVAAAKVNVNVGGNQASADGSDSGIEVNMTDATNAAISYNSTCATFFELGEVGSFDCLVDESTSQTLLSKELTNTTSINANLALEIVSTAKASKPCPEMTEAQRDALTAVDGSCVYNSTTDKLNIYNGSVWVVAGGGLSKWAATTAYLIDEVIWEAATRKIYRALAGFTSGGAFVPGNWEEIGIPSPGDGLEFVGVTTGFRVQLDATGLNTDSYINRSAANGLSVKVVDEDNMASDSAVLLPTQQSVKAYVDTASGASTLQTAYNNAAPALIILDGTNDGVRIEDNGTPIADDLFEVTDNGNTTEYFKVDVSGTNTLALNTTGIHTVTGQSDIDNLTLNGNTISSTDVNGPINLVPNGTGIIDLQKVTNSLALNTTGIHTVTGQSDIDDVTINGNTVSTNNGNLPLLLTPNGTGQIEASSDLVFKASALFDEIASTASTIGVGQHALRFDSTTSQFLKENNAGDILPVDFNEIDEVNDLLNRSFELADIDSSWTLVAGTAVAETTTKIEGEQSIEIPLTAQTLDFSQVISIDQYDQKYVEFSCEINSTEDLEVCPMLAGVELTSQCIPALGNDKWKRYGARMQVISGNSHGIKIKSSGAITDSVFVDACKFTSDPKMFADGELKSAIGYSGYTSKNGSNYVKFKTEEQNLISGLISFDNSGDHSRITAVNDGVSINAQFSETATAAGSLDIQIYNSSNVLLKESSDYVGSANRTASMSINYVMATGDYIVFRSSPTPNDSTDTNFSVAASKTVSDVFVSTPANSKIESASYRQYAGLASTDNAIPYFTNEESNTISKLGTITNDSTNGLVFTALEPVKVTIAYSHAGAASYFGVTKNSSELTTSINILTNDADIKSFSYSDTANAGEESSYVGVLDIGDILRPHTDKQALNTNAHRAHFNIIVEPVNVHLQANIPVGLTCYIKDVKASATEGGTFTSGSYQTRDLNTLEGDCLQMGITLSSNQIIMSLSGDYNVTGWGSAYRVNSHKTRFQNITDAATSIIGATARSGTSSSDMTTSSLIGPISLSGPRTFELQHRCSTTLASSGFGTGSGFGDSEIYSQLIITKVK